jgi:hypothetical protein
VKFAIVIGLMLLAISNYAYAQDFDAQNGYIFNQGYVTRITESDASALLKIEDAGDVFWNLYDKKGKTTTLANGVKKSSDKLIFKAAGKPDLSLKSYVYKGKGDGDSQRFSYVSELGKYHLVVVEFDHDRPCFILVHKSTLKVYFVDYDVPTL